MHIYAYGIMYAHAHLAIDVIICLSHHAYFFLFYMCVYVYAPSHRREDLIAIGIEDQVIIKKLTNAVADAVRFM